MMNVVEKALAEAIASLHFNLQAIALSPEPSLAVGRAKRCTLLLIYVLSSGHDLSRAINGRRNLLFRRWGL
jgi:hypothetical protein